MRTRDEHLEWCKERAREYLRAGDVENAITSMMSDMGKHPETQINPALELLGMVCITQGDQLGAHRWIEGFN